MMKKILSKLFPALPVGLVLTSLVFSHSCANTTLAPSGGAKDSIPPVIVKVTPQSGICNVPVSGTVFSFTFDEYVKVKDPKGIILSPPQTKPVKTKIHGKTLTIYSEEDFMPNTTYTINFSGAIQDNNEGNDFPGFTYVFSTGSQIDSMMITGIVQDCSTLAPIKGATVLLYKDHADSAVLKQKPFLAAKTDDWGFFILRNIPDTLFRLYAIQDLNNDFIYDPATEMISFVDSLIRPVTVVNDSIPETKFYSMKDTVNCLARKAEYELSLFREKNSKQVLKNQGRLGDRFGFVSFSAPRAHIDTMWVGGISDNKLITQFNPERDSLLIWINDTRRMPDTLNVFVNYRKTDSLGALTPFTEHSKLYVEGVGKKNSAKNTQVEHSDTICGVTLTATPENFEQIGIEIAFDYPIITESFDSLSFYALNPRQQKEARNYKLERDSIDIRKYHIILEEAPQTGYDYILKVPHRGFRDINGYYNDSTEVKVALPTDETLSSVILGLTGVQNKYIIDLQDEKRADVLRTYVVDSDTTLTFPYLKSAKYSIRMTEDVNRNSLVDVGDLMTHRLPEKVKYYKIDGEMQFKVPESSEVHFDINLNEYFNK